MEKWYLILPPSLTSVINESEARKFCHTYLSHTRYSISSMAHLRQVLVVLLKVELLKIPYENHKDLIFFRPKNFIVLFWDNFSWDEIQITTLDVSSSFRLIFDVKK